MTTSASYFLRYNEHESKYFEWRNDNFFYVTMNTKAIILKDATTAFASYFQSHNKHKSNILKNTPTMFASY